MLNYDHLICLVHPSPPTPHYSLTIHMTLYKPTSPRWILSIVCLSITHPPPPDRHICTIIKLICLVHPSPPTPRYSLAIHMTLYDPTSPHWFHSIGYVSIACPPLPNHHICTIIKSICLVHPSPPTSCYSLTIHMTLYDPTSPCWFLSIACPPLPNRHIYAIIKSLAHSLHPNYHICLITCSLPPHSQKPCPAVNTSQ